MKSLLFSTLLLGVCSLSLPAWADVGPTPCGSAQGARVRHRPNPRTGTVNDD